MPHPCQNEPARGVTDGHPRSMATTLDLQSSRSEAGTNKPDPKIGELAGARQHPAERSGAG
jgi:hypothetical protein